MKIQVSSFDNRDRRASNMGSLKGSLIEMLDEGDLQKSPLLTKPDKLQLKNSMRRLTEVMDD